MTCCGLPRQVFSFNSVHKTSVDATRAASQVLPSAVSGKQRIPETRYFIDFMSGARSPLILIFDQGVVGPRHVGKAGAAGRFDTFAASGSNLRLGQTEHAAGAGPRVAAYEHG